jgi:prepilin-type N-terminal cleavage/methylation domain-containing protein
LLRLNHDIHAGRVKHLKTPSNGFTIVELLIVLLLLGVVTGAIYTSFRTSFIEYFALQKDGSNFTQLSGQSQRLASVIRGLTDITSVTSNDLLVYAYFAPTDTYVSQIHYYLNTGKTILYADVTPLTANPPNGTLITANKKTYTVIPNFYQASGVTLFTYLDAYNNVLTLPITDLQTVKGIQISLAVPGGNASGGNQAMTVQVSLRNRKTNL